MYGQYLTCYSLALGMLVTVVGLVGCSQPKDAATQSAAGDRANDSGVQEPAGKVLKRQKLETTLRSSIHFDGSQ